MNNPLSYQDITLKLIALLNKELITSDFFEQISNILVSNEAFGEKIGLFAMICLKKGNHVMSRNLSKEEKSSLVEQCRNVAKVSDSANTGEISGANGVFKEDIILLPLSLTEGYGFFAVRSKSPELKFSQDEFTFFNSVAGLFACKYALCRKDILISTEKDTLDAAAQIERFFAAFPDLSPEMYSKTVLDETRRLTKCSASYACLFDRQGNAFNDCVSSEDPWQEAAIRKEAVKLVPRILSSKKLCYSWPEDGVLSSCVAVPVLYGGNIAGLLMLANPEEGFGPRIARILGRMAQLYSLMMTHKIELRRNAVQNAERTSALAKTWDLIFTFNADGQITYMSPSVEKMGYRVEEVEGHNFREFVPEEDIPRLNSKLEEVLKSGKPSPVFTYRILKKDGTVLLTQLRIVINKVEGLPVSISAILRDITDDIRHLEELHEKQIFYETIFSKSPLSICIADPESRKIIKANRNAENFFSWVKGGLAGQDIAGLFSERDRAAINQILDKGIEKTEAEDRDSHTASKRTLVIGQDGSRIPVMVSFTYINTGIKSPSLVMITEDISAKTRYKREIGFRLAMLNNAPDYLFAVDLASGRIIFGNKAAASLAGMDSKVITGQPMSVFFSSEDKAREMLDALKSNLKLHEKISLTDKKGRRYELETFAEKIRLGGRQVSIIAGRDISEQEKMERQIQQTNATMSAILTSLPDHVQLFDNSNRSLYENRKFATLKQPVADMPGKNESMRSVKIEPDSSFNVKRFLSQVLRTGIPVSYMEDLELADGTMGSFERRIVPIQDGKGRTTRTAAITRDYTEERKKHEKIMELEFILEHIFETSSDFIYVIDRKGRYLMINQSAAGRYGKAAVAMRGKTNEELDITDSFIRSEELAEVFERKKALFFTRSHSYPAGTFYESISCSPVLNEAGDVTSVIVSGRDITKEHEETTDNALSAAKEVVSMKMRPVGHDFNNILTVINGYATLLSETAKGDARITAGLRQILKAVDRATKLTEKFQIYARNPILKKDGEE